MTHTENKTEEPMISINGSNLTENYSIMLIIA